MMRHKISKKQYCILTVLLFFAMMIIYLYENGPLKEKEFRIALCHVISGKYIGLNYAETYEMLTDESIEKEEYGYLIKDNGVIYNGLRKIEFSYYARFYIGSFLDTNDYHRKPFCYIIYYNDEKLAVVVKITPDERGG